MKKITVLLLLSISIFSACKGKLANGCPEKTSIVATSKELGIMKFGEFEPWFIEGAPGNGIVHLVNYENFDPENPFIHEYKNSDRSANIGFVNLNNKKITTGVWPKKDNYDETVSVSIFAYPSNFRAILPGDNGKIEITNVSDDYICGKAEMDDGYASIKGEFKAKHKIAY